MAHFTVEQMQALAKEYVNQYATLVQEARASVAEWKTGTGIMICPLPFHDQFDRSDRYSTWKPTKRKWTDKAPKWPGRLYRHGFDAKGTLRIVEIDASSVQFVRIYLDGMIDDVCPRDGASKPGSKSGSFKRYVLKDGVTTDLYEYMIEDHGNTHSEYFYHQHFTYLEGRLTTSTFGGRSYTWYSESFIMRLGSRENMENARADMGWDDLIKLKYSYHYDE